MSGRGKYVLEVLRFNADKQSMGDWSEPIEHVGYMKGKFKTKKMLFHIMIDIIRICVH